MPFFSHLLSSPAYNSSNSHLSSFHSSGVAHLIEVKHQIKLTNIPKEAIQHLDKEVYRLQICQLVIIRVDASAEKEACIAAVDYPVVAELDEVGLVLLVARRDEAVDLEVVN